MKAETRYRYKTVPVSSREAMQARTDELEHIQNQIDELVAEAARLRAAPLRQTRMKQIAVEPGDPEYENAPIALHVENYQGDWRWQLSNSIETPATSDPVQ